MTLDVAWFAAAACRGLDPEVFFPDRGSPAKADHAKTICAGCNVRHECLEWALNNNEERGVWGGLQPRDRRNLRRQRGIGRRAPKQSCGTTAGYRRHFKADGAVSCPACRQARALYEQHRRPSRARKEEAA